MIPEITALSYSGGKQSHAILEMILMGEIIKPENFIVLNADPGMENQNSYPFISQIRKRCESAGIEFRTAKTALYYDLVTFRERKLKRLDNPPFWTKNQITGKIGRLKQSCTQFYKIAPMRRELRIYLAEKFNIPIQSKRIRAKIKMWIGFAADEQKRADKAKSKVKFITHEFPLISMGFTRSTIVGWYIKNNIPQPPPSVCNACYSNGLRFFEKMYLDRRNDWDQAVRVDDSIRDLSQFGIRDECFVSATCVPLKDMPARDFLRDKPDTYLKHECNSGACFL